MGIISRAKSLNLPLGEYCVFGSGVLELHGIRKAKDVDVLVTEKLYQELKKSGWKRKWIFWRMLWCKALTKGENEAFTNIHWLWKYRPKTKELIDRAEIKETVPFLQLNDLLEFSKHLPREKDKQTVSLITKHIDSIS